MQSQKREVRPANAQIKLDRASERDAGNLMGKSSRNILSGNVQLKGLFCLADYVVADLWTRKWIDGSVDQFVKDPYLFKPVPMPVRTWMYHFFFSDGKVIGKSGSGENGMITHVLEQHAIDAFVNSGMWSPVKVYIPMLLFLTISGDMTAVLFGAFATVLCILIAWLCNSPRLYRLTRLIHFPVRVVFLVILIGQLSPEEEVAESAEDLNQEEWALKLPGLLVAILCIVIEMILGEGAMIMAYKLTCNYEVLKILPNRLFICKRHGAADLDAITGYRRTPVSERVTGMGAWEKDYALIADLKGLIVELRPMNRQDWQLIHLERQLDELKVHKFVGIDIYSPGLATIDAINRAKAEDGIAAAKAGSQPRRVANDGDMKVQEA